MSVSDRVSRWSERLLLASGLACLGLCGALVWDASRYQVEAMAQFDQIAVATASAAPRPSFAAPGEPIGRLEIPRLQLPAIVLEGDTELILQRGIGHLPDTPLPWQGGNSVIAGHRDSFFRPLRHVTIGDVIHLTTPRGRYRYRVARTKVVDPEDLSVLAPTETRTLTLITCYPFRYVGPAPQRFIVQADHWS